MFDYTASDLVRPAPHRGLSRIQRVRGGGESRTVILEHEAQAGREAARVVRVETGGVDRQTGEALAVFWEVTVKLPGKPEVTRTFSHEVNARVAYLVAQYGVVDFTTRLRDLDLEADVGRLWQEPRNMTALARLRESPVPRRTRMNSGDSRVELRSGRYTASLPLSGGNGGPANGCLASRFRHSFETSKFGRLQLETLPWVDLRDGDPSLFREVPLAELQAEEARVLVVDPPRPRWVGPGMHGLPECRCRRECCAVCHPRHSRRREQGGTC